MDSLIKFHEARKDFNREFVDALKKSAESGDEDAIVRLDALKEFHRRQKKIHPAWYVLNPWFDFGDE